VTATAPPASTAAGPAAPRRAAGLRRAAELLRPARAVISAILLVALALAAVGAAEPLALRRVLDALAGREGAGAAGAGVLALLALGLGRELLQGLSRRLAWRTRIGIHRTLTEATGRLHRLPVSVRRQGGVGAGTARLDRSVQGLVGAVSEIAFDVIPGAAYLVLAVAIMLRLEARLALAVIVFAPMTALVPRFAAQHLVRVAARVAALAVGGWLVLRGELSVGALVAFLGYAGGLSGPVVGLLGARDTLRAARVSLEELLGVLDAQDHPGDASDAREVGALRGEVAWDRVSFSWAPGGRRVLDGVDLWVRAGERVAVVGASGSGKSTLVSLVQRFRDPCDGVVRVDGIDVRRLKQVSLRRQVGVVFQDPLLLGESVLANIACGRPGASRAEIEAAARAANAHDFIVRLPGGYDTVVGERRSERGGRLSVGERQRISIARTLLEDPAILILDEPIAALDADWEAPVQAALDRVTAGRTTLVVAHRLSTLVSVDRIVVLQDGRIVEEGSHDALVRAGGHYASLVRTLLPAAA